jgi:hypothetical protein
MAIPIIRDPNSLKEVNAAVAAIPAEVEAFATAAEAAKDGAEDAQTAAEAALAGTLPGYQPITDNDFDFEDLPDASENVGRVLYCADGSAGTPCAVISDGTNWKVIAIGATASDE